MIDTVIDRLLKSHDYEELIEDRIEHTLSDLLYLPKLGKHEKLGVEDTKKHSNYFKDGIKDFFNHMVD